MRLERQYLGAIACGILFAATLAPSPTRANGDPNDDGGKHVSPIIIDTTNNGIVLTDVAGGVLFDMNPTNSYPEHTAWTTEGSDDAFLALDRDANLLITDGKELFGNYTWQPESDERNGFNALAPFDRGQNGGNANGLIDSGDQVFSHLYVWRDVNHNGITDIAPYDCGAYPNSGASGRPDGFCYELLPLSTCAESISLGYETIDNVYDEHGNWFRYRSVITPTAENPMNWPPAVYVYDIFLMVENTGKPPSHSF